MKVEEAKRKAIAAYQRRNGKAKTPFEQALQQASVKVFEAGFDAAVKALQK